MNVYEILVWHGLYHNDAFIQNCQRAVLVHARNKEEAEKKIKLAPESIIKGFDGITIKTSSEFIYHTYKQGTVTIEKCYVYSNGRIPVPLKEFKRCY